MIELSELFKTVNGEVSGPGAWRYVEAVHANDRLSTHKAFNKTSHYLAAVMEELGLVDVELIKYPTDGKTLVGDWLPSPAWDANYGCLEVIEPGNIAGIYQRYPQSHTCIACNSAATPPGGITAEVVDIEAHDAPRSLKGKIALVSTRTGALRNDAIKRGAVAVISDTLYTPQRRMAEPLAVAWENNWHEQWDTPRCAVMLINGLQGQAIRGAIEAGRVVKVKITVDARNYRGHLLTATGVIPGRSRDEEIIGVGHCSEIGANDNASGCGGLLETARTLMTLRKQRGIGPFKRSIRLIFPFECYGTGGYLTRARRTARILGGLNPDMIGMDMGTGGATMNVHAAPDSSPGPGNALIAELLRMVTRLDSRYRWMETAPSINDSAFICDPSVGGPTPMMVMFPDPLYHSNMDTMERISPVTMALNTTTIASYLAYLAMAGSAESTWLARETFFYFRRRLDATCRELGADASTADKSAQLSAIEDIGVEHIAACRQYGAGNGSRSAQKAIEGLISDWRSDCSATARRTGTASTKPASLPAKALCVPVRLEKYLPAGDRLTPAEKRQFDKLAGTSFPWSTVLMEALYWSDGKRTVADIHRRIALRDGISIERMISVFKALDKFNYVRLTD